MSEPIAAAAASDDRRRTLVALRDKIAAAADDPDTPARDLAALSRQLTAILVELDKLAAPKEASPVDSLAARRAARRSTPKAG